jgi:phosphatidylglycerol lysyltransferase
MNIIKNFIKKHGKSIVKSIIFIAILVFIIYNIRSEIKSLDFAKTFMLIRELPIHSLLLLTIIGVLAVSSITVYDFLIIRHLNLDIHPFAIFNISFIASTVNNVSGLGGLTGASIRSVLFKKGDEKTDIFDYNLLLIPATAIGLGVLTLYSLFNYKYLQPIIKNYRFLLLAIIGFIVYLFVYFFIDILFYMFKKTEKDIINSKRFILKLNLLIASTIQWLFSFVLFAIILRRFNNSIGFNVILPIYTLGSIAAIISMLPGGVGSLDLVALVGFQNYGIPTEHILASLILYRVFYNFIPLIVSIATNLIAQAVDKTQTYKLFNTEKFKGVISRTSSLTNLLLSILVFFSGLVLLFSALVPGIAERIKLASKLLSFPIMQWSHQLSITIGIILLNISREIRMRVKRAYNITWWLLLLGAVFMMLKGFKYEEALFLLTVLIILRASKDSFYRRSLPFDWYGFTISALLTLAVLLIFLRLSNVIFLDFLKLSTFKAIFTHELIHLKPNGIVAYALFILYVIMKELTKERISKDERYESVDEDKISNFFDINKGSFLSHLIYLKDKHLYWSNSNKVVIAFEKSHNVIIVLGDPIGDENYFGEAIDEFHKFIDEYGYKSVFYEVSESLLPLYHDHGYYFLKLGETALVDLDFFDIKSPKSRDFRNILNRFNKDGYYFDIIDGKDIDNKIYNQLEQISKEWLNGRNEMGFSLGYLNRNYIEKAPIAFVRKTEDNSIIAFVTLMPKYDNKSYSIDLMRHKNSIPSNTMAFLIINLIVYLKEKSYNTLNLGMAPLSNVGTTNNAHFNERIAHLVFKFGKELYSFSGLRNFKEKFSPNWESRYLAYEDLTMLPASIIEATILIHSKRK